MNKIILDIETTGISFNEGHKIVEIACIEINNFIPTDKIFHKLLVNLDVFNFDVCFSDLRK